MYRSVRQWACERLIDINLFMDNLSVIYLNVRLGIWRRWRNGRPRAAYPPIVASTAFRSTLGNTGLVM